jgi:hypothetical protein
MEEESNEGDDEDMFTMYRQTNETRNSCTAVRTIYVTEE